jgi:hypothetical protein
MNQHGRDGRVKCRIFSSLVSKRSFFLPPDINGLAAIRKMMPAESLPANRRCDRAAHIAE